MDPIIRIKLNFILPSVFLLAQVNYHFSGEIDPQYQAETSNWIMGTASSLFAVLISSLLVAGASQRRRDLVLPWLVAEAIRLSIYCLHSHVFIVNCN